MAHFQVHSVSLRVIRLVVILCLCTQGCGRVRFGGGGSGAVPLSAKKEITTDSRSPSTDFGAAPGESGNSQSAEDMARVMDAGARNPDQATVSNPTDGKDSAEVGVGSSMPPDAVSKDDANKVGTTVGNGDGSVPPGTAPLPKMPTPPTGTGTMPPTGGGTMPPTGGGTMPPSGGFQLCQAEMIGKRDPSCPANLPYCARCPVYGAHCWSTIGGSIPTAGGYPTGPSFPYPPVGAALAGSAEEG